MAKKLVIFALIATILPVFYVLDRVGGVENWEGVPPQGITDSLVYYGRMHEVKDGHPFVGNPFVYEYRESYSPGIFIPDIVSALPLLAGFPLSGTLVFNFFFWTLAFLCSAYALLRTLGLSNRWALTVTLLVYVSSYAFMLRPTVMQIIYPLFLLFLNALLSFLREPHTERRVVVLSVLSALSFYFYNFLAFFVFITCAFLFAWFLVSKQYLELRALLRMGIYTAILLVPFGIYSFFQMNETLYLETLVRMGMVHTHIPTVEAFFFGRWVVIALAGFGLLWHFFPKEEFEHAVRRVFWVVTGCALFASLFLNVVTGVEFTLAIHMGRFIVVWMALAFGVLLYEWYVTYFDRKQTGKILVHGAIGFFVILLAFGVARNLPRALGFFHSDNREVTYREAQTYAGPLGWLETNVPEETVIWANQSIGGYVPVMTKHYPLFHSSATPHPVPDVELEERYLLWRSLEPLSLEDVKRDFELLGAGREKEQPLAINNRVWLCNELSRFTERTCPERTDGITLRGEQYFKDLVARFSAVKERQGELLSRYNVSYLIVDTHRDGYVLPFPTSTAVYADSRFFIFSTTIFHQ